ncbi:hypothetical protein QOM21_10210 [Streptomyces sp. Pv4-95]|uniref:hypothetical protein n=1 Tax=Streptomyces sp. Pv4-95 TaxID=3049543 RepID=UPI003891D923
MGVFSRFRRRRSDAATEENGAAEVRAEGTSPEDSAAPADDAEGSGAAQAAEASSEAAGAPEEPAEVSGETATADEPGADGAIGAAASPEIPRQQSVSDSETDKGARK